MYDSEIFRELLQNTLMKEEIENNSLDDVREANKILRKIKVTCRTHNYCKDCPYKNPHKIDGCILKSDYPEVWKL